MRIVILIAFVLLAAAVALLPGHIVRAIFLPIELRRLVGYDNLLLLGHLAAYGGLVVLGVWIWGRLLPVALAAFSFSAAMEAGQALLPWRDGTLGDVLLNLGAVLLGVAVVLLFRGFRRYLLPPAPIPRP
jgi:hypothetical protein